ncbi:hypothetical protein WA026_001327, partial [Henosepilachna vigintioctopunctata]
NIRRHPVNDREEMLRSAVAGGFAQQQDRCESTHRQLWLLAAKSLVLVAACCPHGGGAKAEGGRR